MNLGEYLFRFSQKFEYIETLPCRFVILNRQFYNYRFGVNVGLAAIFPLNKSGDTASHSFESLRTCRLVRTENDSFKSLFDRICHGITSCLVCDRCNKAIVAVISAAEAQEKSTILANNVRGLQIA
jgi:hypothetical protein